MPAFKRSGEIFFIAVWQMASSYYLKWKVRLSLIANLVTLIQAQKSYFNTKAIVDKALSPFLHNDNYWIIVEPDYKIYLKADFKTNGPSLQICSLFDFGKLTELKPSSINDVESFSFFSLSEKLKELKSELPSYFAVVCWINLTS